MCTAFSACKRVSRHALAGLHCHALAFAHCSEQNRCTLGHLLDVMLTCASMLLPFTAHCLPFLAFIKSA